MCWLNGNRILLTVFGIVAVTVLGGGSVKADFTFGEVVNMGPVINSNQQESGPCISADGLEFYFHSNRDGGVGSYDLWASTRETTDDPWGEPANLGQLVNSPEEDANPTLSADGLELYFNSFRTDGMGGTDIWVTKRAARSDPWGPPENLGPTINSVKHESAPSTSGDGLALYFSYGDPSDQDDPLRGPYVSRRPTKDAPWEEPVSLGSVVNSWPCMWQCEISADGLLFMWSDYWNCDPRPGGYGETDIWFSRRVTVDNLWEEPVNLGSAINTSTSERSPGLTADGSMLYLARRPLNMQRGYELCQAPILPVVDFDDDGEVGMSDLLLMIDSLDTGDPLCDIGPPPWGDGVVNEADLEVLMGHWGENTPIYTVVDDFESYNDDVDAGTAIFHAWIDGVGYEQPAPAHPGNGTGALVGNWPPPFAEQVIVHGGFQSMPLWYDNDGAVWDMSGLTYYAEAQRTWEDAKDWTREGVEILSLWLYGEPDNSAESFYVGLEDSAGNRKDITHPDPAALTVNDWQQWSIPLADFTDVDLTAIKVMYIGVGDPTSNQPGGSGLVRIDDIELHVKVTP